MNFRLVGGLLKEIAGRNVFVTVHENNGSTVICYTFIGSEEDAPAIADTFFDPEAGDRFFTFSRGSIHAVMHREENVICILVSRLPLADLLALSRAKARIF